MYSSTMLMSRPSVVMEREDYAATFELLFLDVKARFRIHNYEVKKLGEDLSLLFNVITDKAYYAAIDR
jgi:hypothetical protein|tara:strand:- start:615 stop:818 length:204 start_codon:yes stop_codon:yes gene_type:complete